MSEKETKSKSEQNEQKWTIAVGKQQQQNDFLGECKRT